MSEKKRFLSRAKLVDWSALKPEFIEAEISEALGAAKKDIEAICAISPEAATFENTFLALENAGEDLHLSWGRVGHLTSVQDSKELRDVYNEMLPKVTEFNSSIPLNSKLWKALKGFAGKAESGGLEGAYKRLFEETVKDFVNAGADLPDEKKNRLEEINKELAGKTQKYSENVLDATNAYELLIEDDSRLAGLPESAIAAARQSAESKGLGSDEKPAWRFTLHIPSLLPVLKYADDRSLREEIWLASSSVGKKEPFDNTALIRDILKLRHEKAGLLGKESFPDHVLQRRMAGSGASALGFVEDMFGKVKDAFDREISELEHFVAERESDSKDGLEPWDVGYWSEKLRREQYDFDEEELRPYFPIDKAIAGMFRIAEGLFGIRIQERDDDTPVWHQEVKVYDLFDRSGALLGNFYADWHPREEKRGGAWMNYLDTGDRSEGAQGDPHIGLICGNLTAPVGDKPALVTHDEVQTIFHEFGHLLHHMLGNVKVKSLNGVNVAWDFVELPSQIMENWCWNKESLDVFARHYETDATIPDELFEKMLAARNFMSGSGTMRQLSFAKMDLELHLNPEKYYEGDLIAAIRETLSGYLMRTKTPAGVIVHRFGHLFSSSVGYAAGYYSYKWAEVLDADAFTRFEQEGIFNSDTGREFREAVLSKGNSEEPMSLFQAFMGREPDPDALLKRSGLAV